MRTPSGWTLTIQAPLWAMCACCALWSLATAALAAPEHIRPAPVESTAAPVTAASTPSNSAARAGGASIDKRVLVLVTLACVVGLIAGRRSRRSRGTPLRLLNRPKKTLPSILVPRRPVPPLIPADSPKATRARSAAPARRQTPAGISSSGVVDYIAAFSDSGKEGEAARVDYLLEAGEGEAADPSSEGGGSSHRVRPPHR